MSEICISNNLSDISLNSPAGKFDQTHREALEGSFLKKKYRSWFRMVSPNRGGRFFSKEKCRRILKELSTGNGAPKVSSTEKCQQIADFVLKKS